MVPAICRMERMHDAHIDGERAEAVALALARRDGAAVLGLSSAVGALGGYFIPRAFGASMATTGGPSTALGVFLGFYALCIVVTWRFYLGASSRVRRAPALATTSS
jgi:NNP family nitrate/nitrite transporter-like MFS transporter